MYVCGRELEVMLFIHLFSGVVVYFYSMKYVLFEEALLYSILLHFPHTTDSTVHYNILMCGSPTFHTIALICLFSFIFIILAHSVAHIRFQWSTNNNNNTTRRKKCICYSFLAYALSIYSDLNALKRYKFERGYPE